MHKKPFIPVSEPLLDGNESKYLAECIESGWISSEGPFVKRFEEQFAARVGRRYGIAVSSGTAALDIAIEALGLEAGDEVILPAFTIISCVGQIVRSGAKPVLVDVDPITWNMDVSQIEAKITNRTKAIMVVHIYGLPVEMDVVTDIARRHNLFIIEDAAEMHGQTYKGKPCGSFGDISIFSFYSNKLVTTGEGGIVLTNNSALAEILQGLRNLCFVAERRFVHERLGWNMRMTNLQAAMGLAQLERLDEFVDRKRAIGRRYNSLFEDMSSVQRPVAWTDAAENIYWVYGLVLNESNGVDAKEAMSRLATQGIGCRPFFCPMHQQPVLRSMGLFEGESYPNSERIYQYGFYIPTSLTLTEEQIARVADAVWEVLG